jgi:hypothetical protein
VEKEAQNGEIASNYLIPDPKRINKPSDFISSFCHFRSGWKEVDFKGNSWKFEGIMGKMFWWLVAVFDEECPGVGA